jgi:hypothetical protein
MIKERLVNRIQTLYVISAISGDVIESMISTNMGKVLHAIKLDIVDFCLNHPNCPNRQALRDFLAFETEEEVNIFSKDEDSFLRIYIEGDYLDIDFSDTKGDKPNRYSLRTHYVSRD